MNCTVFLVICQVEMFLVFLQLNLSTSFWVNFLFHKIKIFNLSFKIYFIIFNHNQVFVLVKLFFSFDFLNLFDIYLPLSCHFDKDFCKFLI